MSTRLKKEPVAGYVIGWKLDRGSCWLLTDEEACQHLRERWTKCAVLDTREEKGLPPSFIPTSNRKSYAHTRAQNGKLLGVGVTEPTSRVLLLNLSSVFGLCVYFYCLSFLYFPHLERLSYFCYSLSFQRLIFWIINIIQFVFNLNDKKSGFWEEDR